MVIAILGIWGLLRLLLIKILYRERIGRKFSNQIFYHTCLFYSLLLLSCEKAVTIKEDTLFDSLDVKYLGIDFENTLTYTEEFNTYLYRSFYNGAGTGLGDFNNDGYLDLYFCGNMVDNKLYLGDGKFNFNDVTQIAGVSSPDAWSTGVSIVDINDDGWLDIYVCKSGDPKDSNRRNEFFLNTGTNKDGVPVFKESAAEYGLDNLGFSVHAQFFDYDLDGDLDMYLSDNSISPTDLILDANKGMREKRQAGGGDKLYRNDNGFFKDVSEESGIYSSAIGFGLGISIADVNRDNWPDIYVANDFFEKDYLYINNKNGTFTESIDKLTNEISLGSMGVDIADMNNDGYPEIFVTEMLPEQEGRLKTKTIFDHWDKYALKIKNGYHRQFPRNMFQLNSKNVDNEGNVVFSEISRYAGVAATDWSWGVQMVDFDMDGQKEIFVTNGIAKDLLDQDYVDFYSDRSKISSILKEKGAVIKELIDKIPSQPLANYMFKQKGNLKYENVASQWGLGQLSFSSGAAYGDIDNDGDLDLVVSNIDAPPFVYRNSSKNSENHFVSITLKNEKGSNAIGAKATLFKDGVQHYQELFPMRGVMSSVDNRLNFGIGTDTDIDSIEIIWSDGTGFMEKNIPIDSFLTYTKSIVNSIQLKEKGKKTDCFLIDVTDELGIPHNHIENNFVDFNRDKLRYQMISNEGPKLAVADVNNDGKDDFYIGGSKDFSGSLYIQHEHGFVSSNKALFEKDKTSEDLGSLFFDADNDGDLDLLVSSGGYEFSSTSFALIDRLYLNDGLGNFQKSPQLLPNGNPSSTSVVINADFDSDGDQDLFFGGRLIPNGYGLPAASRLLKNDGKGNFSDVTESIAKDLLDLGMVTDAVWIDFDKDNDQDLVVVGEWMPIRVFENFNGKFHDVTEKMGLGKSNGFWNTLEVKDLDGDGKEDLIVGNLGENTFFKGSLEKPVKMFVNDFDNNGRIEQIITRFNGDRSYPFALKKDITSQMPFLLKKYLKHVDYSEETIENIFSKDELKSSLEYQVFENRSVVLWNDSDRFILDPLPFNTQFSPVYAIYANDIDGDGNIDLVLGGNQFNSQPQTGIYGASFGTVLKGYGRRKFEVMDFSESGFFVKGQVRDLKEIVIRGKGYLLEALNDDKTRIYEIRSSNK